MIAVHSAGSIVYEKFAMRVLVFTVLFTLGLATVFMDEAAESEEYWIYREAFKFLEECGDRDYLLCLKERSLQYLDNLPNSIDLGGGFRIRQTDGNRTSRQHASLTLPMEPKAREEALDKALWEGFEDYLSSHSFEYKIPNENLNELEKTIDEGRKKKGGGGMRMRSFLMLLLVKGALLGAIGLKFIGLVAFKALMLAKIAFVIAALVALKKEVEQKSHSSTYEVYAHPHYDEHSFDRAFRRELPYRDQIGSARSSV